MTASTFQQYINDRTRIILEKARQHCEQLIRSVTEITNAHVAEHHLDAADVCFVVVGSVGRFEGLEASDLDFTPVLRTPDDSSVRGSSGTSCVFHLTHPSSQLG